MRLGPLALLLLYSIPAGADGVAGLADKCAQALHAIPQRAQPTEQFLREPDVAGAAEAAFRICLASYIQVRTDNPPGHDRAAAAFWQAIFRELQWPHQIYFTEGRANLIATLSPQPWQGWRQASGRSAIVLLHHTDVVPVIDSQWKQPGLAWSGEEKDGHLWGRGALDMKSVGIMQLLALVLLQRSQQPFAKDIHFLANADEEVGARGATGTIAAMKAGGALAALGPVEALLNEGGFALDRSGRPFYLIATEEKGGAWLRLTHAQPLDLVSFIQDLGLIPEPAQLSGKALACTLIRFTTPHEQVNVVPSQAELTLRCQGDLRAEPRLQSAFAPATVEAQQVGQDWQLRIALASASHGALGGRSVLAIAARGLQKLGIWPLLPARRPAPDFFRYQTTPAIRSFVAALDELSWLPVQWVMRLLGQRGLRLVGDMAYSEVLFRSVCSWTGLRLEPGKGASALLDCRLLHLHGQNLAHGPAFVSQLREWAVDPSLQLALVQGWNHTRSLAESAAFSILRESVLAFAPEAVVSEWLAPTSSDSARYRSRPGSAIPAYGFFPVITDGNLVGSIHGSDERFPLAQARPALQIYALAVSRLAR